MNPATVLIVDDSKSQCAFYQSVFAPHYQVLVSHSGTQALEQLADSQPDLIVLDIEMPGLDGYQTCQLLRERGHDLPVLFASGQVELTQRLRAYDVGGNDFICKPLSDAELLRKVALLLRQREEQQRLRDDGQQAFATAITAMTTMSEMGVLIDFLRQCGNLDSYQAIAERIAHTLTTYGLHGCMALFGEQQYQHSTMGAVTPLESSIIASSLALPRIFTSGNNTTFNYSHSCLVVRDMPDDEDRSGRLRDHLAILSEAAANRVQALDQQQRKLATLEQELDRLRGARQQLHAQWPQRCADAGLDAAQQATLLQFIEQQFD